MENEECNEHFAIATDIGKKRKNNEDCVEFVQGPDSGLLVVCDGMGGHRKGEVASNLIKDCLSLAFQRNRKKFNLRRVKHFFHKQLKLVNKEIYRLSMQGNELTHLQEFYLPNTAYSSLLLCTDGLYNMVSESEMVSVLKDKSMDVKRKAKTLIDLALEHGGNDNIAVAIWEN